MQQASAQAENARIQQLYANRAAEQRKQELDFQMAQAKNRKLALEQDAVARQKQANKQKAEQATRGNLAKGAAKTQIAGNGLLLEDVVLGEDEEATSALLLADIEVATINQINDQQFAADLDVRRLTLQAAEEEANISQLSYSSAATVPDMVAPGPNKSMVAATSLINGATSVVGAGYKSGYLTKDTFTGGGTFSSPIGTTSGSSSYQPGLSSVGG
jgi:hypothetical protein